MNLLKSILFLSLTLSLFAHANFEIDRREELNGVSLISGKEDSTRTYQGFWHKKYNHPIDVVKKGITNYPDRCNNEYKDKRIYTDKTTDCKYLNSHLVESFIVPDINKNALPLLPGETERYLVGRVVYNRGSYGYYELVQIVEGLNAEGKKTLTIYQKMLDDDEVKKFTDPKISKESPFRNSTAKYTLVELGPKSTHLSYEFEGQTSHWVLNKEVSVPQVFSSIGQSINLLEKSIDLETANLTRQIASEE